MECSLCYETTWYVAVGVCGHAEVCWLCALRLRWICKDNACAICKEPLDEIRIVGVNGDNKSEENSKETKKIESVSFGSDYIYEQGLRLTQYCCPYECGGSRSEDFRFRTLHDLQTHLKRDHEGAMFCAICLDFRQAFVSEQKFFSSSSALAEHMKAEHAMCEFCHSREYSTDELLVHMNQAHFKCLICDRLDYRNEYYANFESLDRHFEEAHFKCDFPECKEQRFVVFPEEEDLRLHFLDKHGGRRPFVMTNFLRRKYRNKNSKTTSSNGANTVHFRGPRARAQPTMHSSVREYPPCKFGKVYDKRVHAKNTAVIKGVVETEFDFKRMRFLGRQDPEYQEANVAFLKRLANEEPQCMHAIKALSREYLAGKVGAGEFFSNFKKNLKNPKNFKPLFSDLVRLMPDAAKRDALIEFITGGEVQVNKKKVTEIPPTGEKKIDMPDNLGRKPCLIQALVAVLNHSSLAASKEIEIPQSILSAIENKVIGSDRVQLTTLSEMRSHLLTIAEARASELSWKNADALLSLRPLLYRLLHIPESHKSQERKLLNSGWNTFSQSALNVVSQFSETERFWLKAYITFSVIRLSQIGDTNYSKRFDFPTLPTSAYFPTIPAAPPQLSPVPNRAEDFPVALPAPQARSLVPVVSNRQWQNSAQNLMDDSFPQLVTGHAPPPLARPTDTPWNCPRCTFLNTRLASVTCEICGMDRPPPGEHRIEPTAIPAPAVERPRRTKQRIVLSSSTQRDYTR